MMFPATSRYHLIESTEWKDENGQVQRYLKRRFLPPTERFTVIQEHVVTEGERLDNLTARYLGDPEQFWRICDANAAMRPDELTEEPERRLRITLPEGLPGTTHV
jgi:hypothetical protein